MDDGDFSAEGRLAGMWKRAGTRVFGRDLRTLRIGRELRLAGVSHADHIHDRIADCRNTKLKYALEKGKASLSV